jgi:hypothetical protein
MYLCPEEELGGVVKMTPAEAAKRGLIPPSGRQGLRHLQQALGADGDE